MANIDPQGEALQEVVRQVRDHGVAIENCIIQSVPDDQGLFRMIAISKESGLPLARSWPFRPTITGSFLGSISPIGRRV